MEESANFRRNGGRDGLPEVDIPTGEGTAAPSVRAQLQPGGDEKVREATEASAGEPARRRWLPAIIAVGAVALLGGAATYGHHYWTVSRFVISTDDAYVGARSTTLSPKSSPTSSPATMRR